MRGRGSVWRMVEYLNQLEPGANVPLAQGMKDFAIRNSGKGIVVLISDLLDKSGYQSALNYLLARQMDIYVIHVLANSLLNCLLRMLVRLRPGRPARVPVITCDRFFPTLVLPPSTTEKLALGAHLVPVGVFQELVRRQSSQPGPGVCPRPGRRERNLRRHADAGGCAGPRRDPRRRGARHQPLGVGRRDLARHWRGASPRGSERASGRRAGVPGLRRGRRHSDRRRPRGPIGPGPEA